MNGRANALPAARRAETYSLCGVGIQVTATDKVSALIGARLRFLRSAASDPASIVFDIRAGGADNFAEPPAGPARPVYDAPGGQQLLYFDDTDKLFIEHAGCLRMLCSPASGLVQSAVLSAVPGNALAAYPFFTIPLIQVMRRKGRFPLHAGCVSREGRGVLLAGSSGAGKSTLTTALVKDGWDFLSDDMVLLAHRDGERSAWGFSDEIDCSDDTAGMFPELRHLAGRPTPPGRDKHRVDVEEAFGVIPVPECRPHALVLLTISGERGSILRAVSASDALRELAPNVLLTRRAATQAHLDALAELVSEVPCYSLATGTDLSSASRQVQGVLG